MESYPVKNIYFLMKFAYFTPVVMVTRELLHFFSLEMYFNGFLDPRNVHFDTNFIIIA